MRISALALAAALSLGVSGTAQADVGCCILQLNKGQMCLTTSFKLCNGSPRFVKWNGWQYCANHGKGPPAKCENKKEGEDYEGIAKEQGEITESILRKLQELDE